MKTHSPHPSKVCRRHSVLFSGTSGGGRISGHYGRCADHRQVQILWANDFPRLISISITMFRIRIMVKKTLFSLMPLPPKFWLSSFLTRVIGWIRPLLKHFIWGSVRIRVSFVTRPQCFGLSMPASLRSRTSPSELHELYEKEKPGRIQLLQRFLASLKWSMMSVCIGSILGKYYTDRNQAWGCGKLCRLCPLFGWCGNRGALEEQDGKIREASVRKMKVFGSIYWPSSLTAEDMLVRPVSMWKTRLMPFILLWWMRW